MLKIKTCRVFIKDQNLSASRATSTKSSTTMLAAGKIIINSTENILDACYAISFTRRSTMNILTKEAITSTLIFNLMKPYHSSNISTGHTQHMIIQSLYVYI